MTRESGVLRARPSSLGGGASPSKPPAADRSRLTRLTIPTSLPRSFTTGRRFSRRRAIRAATSRSGVPASTVTGGRVITSPATWLEGASRSRSACSSGPSSLAARFEPHVEAALPHQVGARDDPDRRPVLDDGDSPVWLAEHRVDELTQWRVLRDRGDVARHHVGGGHRRGDVADRVRLVEHDLGVVHGDEAVRYELLHPRQQTRHHLRTVDPLDDDGQPRRDVDEPRRVQLARRRRNRSTRGSASRPARSPGAGDRAPRAPLASARRVRPRSCRRARASPCRRGPSPWSLRASRRRRPGGILKRERASAMRAARVASRVGTLAGVGGILTAPAAVRPARPPR